MNKIAGIRLFTRKSSKTSSAQDIIVSIKYDDGVELELINEFGALSDIEIDHFVTNVGINAARKKYEQSAS